MSTGFEQILSGILGGEGGQEQGGRAGGGAAMAGMAAIAAPLLLNFLKGGGLQKLLGAMQSKGMEDKAQSWVSTGENRAITSQELEEVIGRAQIDQLAQQSGASPQQAEEVLAQALPQVVDKVTPEGKVPDQSQLDDLLGQLFGRKQ